MDQTLRRVATKEREEIKKATKQKMTRRHNKEGANHLEQESNRQKTMEDIDGGLHPAVDGQSLISESVSVSVIRDVKQTNDVVGNKLLQATEHYLGIQIHTTDTYIQEFLKL